MSYRPWTVRDKGIEMETTTRTTDRGSVSDTMLRHAVERAVVDTDVSERGGYYHSNGDTWDVKSDSSCGWEIVSPKFRMDAAGDFADLRRVCSALEGLRPRVDRTCGLHVHVDCSDFDWTGIQRLLRLWVRYEPFFFELMPPQRRSNTFCQSMSGRVDWSNYADTHGYVWDACQASTQREFERRASQLNRYSCLNIAGWWRNRRVEFRLHSGTINYAKIRNWTMLCGAVVNRAQESSMPEIAPLGNGNPTRPFSTSYMMKMLGLLPSRFMQDVPQESIQLAAWLNARRLQFTPSLRAGGSAPVVAVNPT